MKADIHRLSYGEVTSWEPVAAGNTFKTRSDP